jgi:hypothetical protein
MGTRGGGPRTSVRGWLCSLAPRERAGERATPRRGRMPRLRGERGEAFDAPGATDAPRRPTAEVPGTARGAPSAPASGDSSASLGMTPWACCERAEASDFSPRMVVLPRPAGEGRGEGDAPPRQDSSATGSTCLAPQMRLAAQQPKSWGLARGTGPPGERRFLGFARNDAVGLLREGRSLGLQSEDGRAPSPRGRKPGRGRGDSSASLGMTPWA